MNVAEYSVRVQNLTRVFGSFKAVENVSFDVRRGEVFGFLGPNGAGKSTTIRMLCGLLSPTSGTALVGGIDVSASPEQVKLNIGYMSQKFSLYEDLTVEQNIRFYGGIYRLTEEEVRARGSWVVQMAGLRGKETELTGSLSGGWKQRLALGCAILHKPPILFLDEPTGGVDPVSRRRFWDLIYQLSSEGTTVFVTTHYMDEAEHCNTIGFIYAGRLVAIGSPSELKQLLTTTETFEVHCDRPLEAIGVLQQEPWAAETSVFGSALHATVEAHRSARERIRKSLSSHGISVSKAEAITPTLEDVFIRMISQEDKRLASGGAA